LNPLINSLGDLRKGLESDYALRELLEDALNYAERCVDSDVFMHDPDSIKRGAEIIRRSRTYLFSHHRQELERIFLESNSFLEDLQNDPLTMKLTDQLQGIADIVYNRE
jgi:hypothetical protein